MVCQAASQTRFRALKYENGIAGRPTIVVRIIACFQPMEDCQIDSIYVVYCQAGNFGFCFQLLFIKEALKELKYKIEHCPSSGGCSSWMVQTNNSWFFPQHSSRQLPKLSCMSTSLQPRQPECLPVCINPSTHFFSGSMSMQGSLVPGTNPGIHMLPANIAMPGSADISVLKTEQKYHSLELLRQLCPCFPTSLPSPGTYLNEQQFMIAKGQSGRATAKVVSGSLQKGLLIFDQSASQTRLIYGSVHPPSQYATTATTELASCPDLHEGRAVKTNPFTPTPPTLHEEYDENNLSAEEGEVHEDTEELNALLYSDEDDDDHEVISSDHSPVGTKRNYLNQDHVDDIMEEVASSDGPNKRQKLLNGGHKQSIMVDAACSGKLKGSHEYDSDAESSYGIGKNQRDDMDSRFRSKQSKKDKIRLTLKILESIIPGAKGKNPLLVLDESIDYLKSLKLEAKTLGVNHY
ncbi:transcription factor bHLH143-like [Durio zibethinus]|uniref:Transcription factor bHLH143-like n=1 Tax=Durio zibethinus TaxID=66656 RepID=A0A6P5Z7V0_DURZI|nr:transcription factor bHLH143-like [Durio zibethinus]